MTNSVVIIMIIFIIIIIIIIIRNPFVRLSVKVKYQM